VAQSGSHVAAAQAYGTIPHDLSKMDANQTAVYQAAVAADQRMKLAQNTSTGAVSDAGAGITGQPQQPQPLQPAAPQQPGMGAPMMSMDALKNTVLQRAFRNASGVPLTPVENQVLAAGMYPQGSSMNRLVLNEATKAAGIPTFIGGERPGVPGRSLSGFDANGMPQYTTAFQNPSVERGQLVGPGGSISTAPGYVPSMAEIENARSFAKVPAAMYEKGVNVLPGGAVGPVAGFAPTMGAQKGAEAGAVATATNQANYGGLMPGGAIPSGAGPSAFGPAAPGPAAPGAAPPAAPPIAVPGIKPGDPIPLGLAQTNMTARVAAQYRPVDTGRGTLIPPLNSQVIPGSAEELKSAIPAWQTKTTQWTDAIAPAQAAEQRLQTVASAFKTIQTGAWQSDKAEVSAMMRSLGLPESWLFTNPEAVEKALHANVVGTLQNLKSTNPRFAQSEFKVLSANSENPNLQPGANLELLSQDMATLSQSQQLARDWNDAQQLGWKNPLSFETQWTQQNPLSTAVEWQRQNIGPLMGMPGGPGTPGAARIFHDPTTGHEIIQRGGQWLDRQTGMPLNTPAPSAPSVPIR